MRSAEVELKRLFERGLDGDQTAYREFLARMSEFLRGYVRRQLFRVGRAQCDAEDIVQEALLAIHAKRHVYERDVPITAWAHAITRYKLIDFLRATGDGAHDLALHDIEDVTGSDGAAIDAAMTIGKLVARLPERMRRPIELMKLNGLSVSETAELTGMSQAAVKVSVHRGLKTLARLFERTRR